MKAVGGRRTGDQRTRWGERKGSLELVRGMSECFLSKACAKVHRPEGTWGNGVWGVRGTCWG